MLVLPIVVWVSFKSKISIDCLSSCCICFHCEVLDRYFNSENSGVKLRPYLHNQNSLFVHVNYAQTICFYLYDGNGCKTRGGVM